MKTELQNYIKEWATRDNWAECVAILSAPPTYERAGRLSDLLDCHGVETVLLPNGNCRLEYINTGDTYTACIAFESTIRNEWECGSPGEWFITSWGDWYEAVVAEHCEDTNTVQCGNCGEHTEYDAASWDTSTCEHCSNLIGG